MHKTTRKILSQLRKDRASTVQAIAKSAGVDTQVARRHLDALVVAGTAVQESLKLTGKRGRPAKLYRKAA